MVKSIAVWILLTWIVKSGKKRILIFGNTWDEMGTEHPQWNRAKMSENFLWNYFLSSVWKFREVLSILYANSTLERGLIFYFSKNMDMEARSKIMNLKVDDEDENLWTRSRIFFAFPKNMRNLGYRLGKRWNFSWIMVKL